MMNILGFLYRRRVLLLVSAVILLAGVVCWQVWHKQHPERTVTYEQQQQAERPQGIIEAANNAHIPVSLPQSAEAAVKIEQAAGQKPRAVVRTTASELPKVVEAERQKSGADFTIVAKPEQAVPKGMAKLEEKPSEEVIPKGDTPVVLNQYNIKAYPSHLIEATVYSAKDYDAAYLSKIKVLGATGYIGPVVARNDNNTKIGVRVSIPF